MYAKNTPTGPPRDGAPSTLVEIALVSEAEAVLV